MIRTTSDKCDKSDKREKREGESIYIYIYKGERRVWKGLLEYQLIRVDELHQQRSLEDVCNSNSSDNSASALLRDPSFVLQSAQQASGPAPSQAVKMVHPQQGQNRVP